MNEFFFLTDPDHFIATHFPEEEKWQLLQKPYTEKQFETEFYHRERFFDMGMEKNDKTVTINLAETKTGELDLSFDVDSESAKNAHYKYLLYRSQDLDAAKAQEDRFVFFTKSYNSVNYNLKCPENGRYKLDLFGKDITKHENFDLVCSYLIESKKGIKNLKPLPDSPDIGWGCGPEAQTIGLQPLSHPKAIIDTKDGKATIKFKTKKLLSVMCGLKRPPKEEYELKDYFYVKSENDEVEINVRLPEPGEYAMNIFAASADAESTLSNVCNYLIRCDKTKVKHEPFPAIQNGCVGSSYLGKKQNISTQEDTDPDGKVKMAFNVPSDMDAHLELVNNKIDDNVLVESVKRTEDENGKAIFEIDPPKPGEYSANVFLSRKKNPAMLYHIYSKLIEAKTDKGADLKECEKPELPRISILTDEDHVKVTVPTNDNKPLKAEITRKLAQDEPLHDQIISKVDNDQANFEVKLPHEGEYELNVYEETTVGLLEHVGVFVITRVPPTEFEDDSTTTVSHGVNRLHYKSKAGRLHNCCSGIHITCPVFFGPVGIILEILS